MKSTQEITRDLCQALKEFRQDFTDDEKADRVAELTEQLKDRRFAKQIQKGKG